MKLIGELFKRRKDLEVAIGQTQKILSKKVEGRLDITKQGEHFRYYKIEKDRDTEQSKKHYIPKDRIYEAKKIANRDYAKQVYQLANKQIKVLDQLIKILEDQDVYKCYDNLHEGRKDLVVPIVMSDEFFAKQWITSQESHHNSYEFHSQIFTENNEQVRSKSEKIIADKLNIMGIPYKYEQSLILGSKIYFPDFTILKKQTRETIYWEHFGLCDQPEYMEKMIEKIDDYSQHHIITGKNLICTFESKNHPLSSREIDNIIRECLL